MSNPFLTLLSKITRGKVKAPVASAKKVMPAHQAAVANDASNRTLAAQHTFTQLMFKTIDEFLDYVLDPKHFASSKVIKKAEELAVAQSANPDKAKVREQLKSNPALLARFVREEPEVATAITEFVIANMPEIIALMAKEGSQVNHMDDTKMKALTRVFEAVARVEGHKAKLINQTAFPNFERVNSHLVPSVAMSPEENLAKAIRHCPQVAMGELGAFIVAERASHDQISELNKQLAAHAATYNQEVGRLRDRHKSILDTKADTEEKKNWVSQFNATIMAYAATETALETPAGWLPPETIAELKNADPNAEADISHYIASIKTFADANNLVGKKPGSIKYDDIALRFDSSVPPIKLINAIFKRTEKKGHSRIYMSASITSDEINPSAIETNAMFLTDRQGVLMEETYARLAERELSDADATTFGLVELKKVVKTKSFEAAPFAVKQELYKYIMAERVRKINAAKAKAAAGTAVAPEEQAIIRQYNQFLIDHIMTRAIVTEPTKTQEYIEQKARRQGLVTLNSVITTNDATIQSDCNTYNIIAGHLTQARAAIDADLEAITTANGDRRYQPFVATETTVTSGVAAVLPANKNADGTAIDYIPEPQLDADGKLTGISGDISVIREIPTAQLATDIEGYKTNCETALDTASTILSDAYTAFDTEGDSANWLDLTNQIITLSETATAPLIERVINHTVAITDLASEINVNVYGMMYMADPMPAPYVVAEVEDEPDFSEDEYPLRESIYHALARNDKSFFEAALPLNGLEFTEEGFATLLMRNGIAMDEAAVHRNWIAINPPEAE